MFRRKKGDEGETKGRLRILPVDDAGESLSQFPRQMRESVNPAGRDTPFHPDVPSARVEVAATRSRVLTPPESESKKLTVGKDISLSGEITACEKLIVEGVVDANLSSGRLIEISKSGRFKGAATVDNADIAGQFEGDLSVRNRLIVRASGRVSGTIRYGQIEVERGGRLTGEMAHDDEGRGAEIVSVAGGQESEPAPSVRTGLDGS